MQLPESFCKRLRWAIYEWLGAISVRELAANRALAREIEVLCKRLNAITT